MENGRLPVQSQEVHRKNIFEICISVGIKGREKEGILWITSRNSFFYVEKFLKVRNYLSNGLPVSIS